MTASTDMAMAGRSPDALVGSAAWRAHVQRAQQRALPSSGAVLVSAAAPFGGGGIGRHLQEIVGALEQRGQPHACICESPSQTGAEHDRAVRALTRLLRPLGRFSPGWRLWLTCVKFDADAAHRAPAAEHLIAFNSTALAQFRAARAKGCAPALVSATAHMRHVVRQQARAYAQYPLERPWASRLLSRNLREYAYAERIYVSSRYVWESFRQEGFPDEALALFPLSPDPRYTPARAPLAASTFDIVYVGGFTVDKGVPLLLDAVARLPHADMRLLLVGGWKTRAMRNHIQAICARDERIVLCPGEPLPRVRGARLYVHAGYSDGFGYAPAEAMACGVPVLVSEDTGMKELITPGVDGMVLPTGEVAALAEAIDAAYRGELFTAAAS